MSLQLRPVEHWYSHTCRDDLMEFHLRRAFKLTRHMSSTENVTFLDVLAVFESFLPVAKSPLVD